MSGLGAIVKLAGDSVSERTVKDDAALRITLGELPKNPPAIFKPPIPPDPDNPILPEEKQLPTTRMAELAVLRKVFSEAQRYQNQGSGKTDSKMAMALFKLPAGKVISAPGKKTPGTAMERSSQALAQRMSVIGKTEK